MKIISLLAAALGNAVKNTISHFDSRNVFHGPTPAAPKKGRINKDGLPRGYPGAKLARRAAQGAVAVKHMGGLRLNGTTYKTGKQL
jgi:hypothetical protein